MKIQLNILYICMLIRLIFFKYVAGKVPGAPLHVYYIQFGQYADPMGSDRPPWAAGE